MTKTASSAALLHVAIRDLYAGKIAQAERLPALVDAARDPALKALLATEAAQARVQAARLGQAGGDKGGPANLWMGGILDDAERDARSHQPGPLLDVAPVGAIRKAKAAEIVSSETAIALARAEGLEAIEAEVAANRAEEVASDRTLKERLGALTAQGTRRCALPPGGR